MEKCVCLLTSLNVLGWRTWPLPARRDGWPGVKTPPIPESVKARRFLGSHLSGNVGRESEMQRYPDNTTANIEDFRRSNWKAAIDASATHGYSGMWQGLSAAANAAVAGGRFSEGKVLWLLADACSMMVNPKSANTPFKPLMVTRTGRSPIPEDIQAPDVDLLAQISEDVDDPWIQGRLADLVWLLKKPRSPKYALAAIDAYRKIPLDAETWLSDGRECWERAITLSRMLRTSAGQRLREIESAIVAAFKGTTKEDGFHSLWLGELLFASGLGHDESFYIANKLASLAQFFDDEGSFHKARSFFDAAAKCYKRAGDKEKWIEMSVSLAEGWAKEAVARMTSTQPSNAVAASFYENSIQTYRTIPRAEREARRIRERIAELHRLMNEAGRKAVEEMGRVNTGPIDITQMIETARNATAGKSAPEALAALANIHGLVPVAQRRKRSEEMLTKYPLHGLFSSIHMSRDGRIIAKSPGAGPSNTNSGEYQAAVLSEMVRNYEMELGLVIQGAVWPALEVLILEHRLREGDFVEIARHSPIVPDGRERLFGKALFLGYERDFAGALHVLVPQIEHMVRWHLNAAGVRTTNLDENGVENENGLSTLVDLPETAKIFGDGLAFEIKALFCVAFGPNLRNELAHGLLDYEACESIYSIYAWWLALKLVFTTFWNVRRDSAVESEDERREKEGPESSGQGRSV